MAPATFVNTNGNNTDINVSKKTIHLTLGHNFSKCRLNHFQNTFTDIYPRKFSM